MKKKLQSVREELSEICNDIHSITADVSHPAECKKAIETVLSRDKRLDVLINSAGVSYSGPTVTMTEKIWNKTIDINETPMLLSDRDLSVHRFWCYSRILTIRLSRLALTLLRGIPFAFLFLSSLSPVFLCGILFLRPRPLRALLSWA